MQGMQDIRTCKHTHKHTLDGPANRQKATVTAPPFDISEIYNFSFFKKREIYFSIWVSVCMFVCLACLAYRYASGSAFCLYRKVSFL